MNQCPKLTHLSLTGVAAFYMRDDLDEFCRDAPDGMFGFPLSFDCIVNDRFSKEFTDHQRTVFCVFSGDGVNRLRNYLNADPQSLYDPETTMYDDREATDGDNDQQVTSLMNTADINDDDDGEEDTEAMEGSQFGGEVEG